MKISFFIEKQQTYDKTTYGIALKANNQKSIKCVRPIAVFFLQNFFFIAASVSKLIDRAGI